MRLALGQEGFPGFAPQGEFVLDGALEAAGQEGSVEIDRNERLTAINGELRSPVDDAGAVRDDFAEWNADRDDVHTPRASTRYLPSEIDEYQDEFDAYGRWTYEQPYGYVWVPSIYESDWRPYYHGRWVWYPIIGWTWVSSEPWGWAAYHYGRWHWRLGLGWHWIPTRHWGPAWVHWWWDYDYCGWCPLGWYNRPIIIVDNHFYHHDRDRDYPRHSRALTVVRRDQLQSRQVNRAALRADRIDSISRVSLRAQQPDIRPVVDRASLDQRAGARILARENVRGVVRSFSPGQVRAARPRLSSELRGQGASGAVERSSLGGRSSASEPRAIRGGERAMTPRALSPQEFKTYPSRRTDGSTSRSIRSPLTGIKAYPTRTEAPSSSRSERVERRDQPSSSRSLEPREFESRLSRPEAESSSPRSSSGSLGEILRTFRSRLSGAEPRSEGGDRDSSDDPSPRSRSLDAPDRRLTYRYDDRSEAPRSSRSYDSPSRESSSPSSSYSPRSRESSSSSSSRSGVSSRSSGSRSSSSPSRSSSSRSSGSSSRSGSSGRIRKK